jgi:hypothetical protein
VITFADSIASKKTKFAPCRINLSLTLVEETILGELLPGLIANIYVDRGKQENLVRDSLNTPPATEN